MIANPGSLQQDLDSGGINYPASQKPAILHVVTGGLPCSYETKLWNPTQGGGSQYLVKNGNGASFGEGEQAEYLSRGGEFDGPGSSFYIAIPIDYTVNNQSFDHLLQSAAPPVKLSAQAIQ